VDQSGKFDTLTYITLDLSLRKGKEAEAVVVEAKEQQKAIKKEVQISTDIPGDEPPAPSAAPVEKVKTEELPTLEVVPTSNL